MFMPRMARIEEVPSQSMPADSYISRYNYDSTKYGSLKGTGSPMMMTPTSYTTYSSPTLGASPSFSDAPISSPMQPEFQDSNDALSYLNSPHLNHGGYATPAMLQSSPSSVHSDYYGQNSLVSPPITPLECQSPYNSQVSSFKVDDEHYPTSSYNPSYTTDFARPLSAGSLGPHRAEMYSSSIPMPIKRAGTLGNNRFAKSLSPPRSIPSSSPQNKRPSYSKWTPAEDEMLRRAIAIHGTSKWSLVASMVRGRTAMQCSTRWQGALNTSIHKGKWEPEEDRILIAAVESWRAEHPPRTPSSDDDDDEQSEAIPWGLIAQMLPRRRTGIQCQARWSEALDPTVRKGKWTPEEDDMLYRGVAEFGTCWIKVASRVRGRTQRQIRTRWMQIRGREKGQS
jgi:Myb-like DNA-binding domain